MIESFSSGLGASSIRFVVDLATHRRGSVLRHTDRFTASQFENDVPIWENKVYRPTPILCDGDGLIAEFRRWCQQFYAAAV